MTRPPCPLEEDEQRVLAQWLDLCLGPHSWFHVPNGNKLRKAQAGVNKAIGVKAGVPDIIIVQPPPAVHGTLRANYVGVTIELKRVRGSKTSPEQVEWQHALWGHGWYAAICYGAEDAIAKLVELGYGRGGT